MTSVNVTQTGNSEERQCHIKAQNLIGRQRETRNTGARDNAAQKRQQQEDHFQEHTGIKAIWQTTKTSGRYRTEYSQKETQEMSDLTIFLFILCVLIILSNMDII